jgi:hypothetical protein
MANARDDGQEGRTCYTTDGAAREGDPGRATIRLYQCLD